MPQPPRVAFFSDSFHEVNGVAHTSRNFVAFAERHQLPMLSVRAGERTRCFKHPESTVLALELRRSAFSFGLEKDLRFDPLFVRHLPRIGRTLRRFRPDLVHITGPSELGIAGAWFAWRLGLPLAASWHTNVHEYAARRLRWLSRLLPPEPATRVERVVENAALWATTRFYSQARVLYAPNPALCTLLSDRTGRPCHLMQRGVDTALFSPAHRTRAIDAPQLVLGYVGRLSVEKNVEVLPMIARELHARGLNGVRFRIIGHGKDEAALRATMPGAEFAGVLRGEALAQAYADLDVLLFPSHTDTFGNVVLEALASGVPAVVTAFGGPQHIVRHGETGLVVPPGEPEARAFTDAVAALALHRERLRAMRAAARDYALTCSWNAVFEAVYAGYRDVLPASAHRPQPQDIAAASLHPISG